VDGLLILSIETATNCGSVSLTRGGAPDCTVVAECTTQPEITHSRRLMGSVDWVMKSAGVSWDELSAIAVSLGPGSFTGLRIGMAAAKGMAMATGKPMVGVPTLDALALACGVTDRLICCVLDARKQEVYAAFYRLHDDGLPRAVTKPVVLPAAQLLQDIVEPVVFVGPGIDEYRELFATCEHALPVPSHLSQPRAVHVGLLAAQLFSAGRTLDPVTAAPMYVRAPEAEVNLKKSQCHQ